MKKRIDVKNKNKDRYVKFAENNIDDFIPEIAMVYIAYASFQRKAQSQFPLE